MASIHSFFRNDLHSNNYVPSPRNQKMEAWWSYFRRSRVSWWIFFLNTWSSQGAYVAEKISMGFLWWFQATSVEVLRETLGTCLMLSTPLQIVQEVFKRHWKIAHWALHENEAKVWKCLKNGCSITFFSVNVKVIFIRYLGMFNYL